MMVNKKKKVLQFFSAAPVKMVPQREFDLRARRNDFLLRAGVKQPSVRGADEMIYGCLHPLCHPQYFFCLLLIFTIELVAGVLAYVYYQKVSDHLCVFVFFSLLSWM